MTNLNTDSGLGQGPGLIILSPSGAVIRYNVVGWSPNGTGNAQPTVVAPPVGGISMAGTGSLVLSGYNTTGRQGTVDVVFTTGVAGGSDQFVAGVVDSRGTPTGYLGIFVDNENRPFVVITDALGITVASTEPIGQAFPAGTTFHAALEWNSSGRFNGQDFVVFEVGDVSEVNWGIEAISTWTPFQPVALLVGVALGAYAAFTGTIGNVQLGNGTPTYLPPVTSFGHQLSLGISGYSTVTEVAKANYAAVVSVAGAAAVPLVHAPLKCDASVTFAGAATVPAITTKCVHSASATAAGAAIVPAITATKAGP
jgi:hypothetical protein